MASQQLPRIDLTDKTVRGLTEHCISIFPDCTRLGFDQCQEIMDNLLISLRLWAESAEATAPAPGSLDQALESRPDDLYEIKFVLFSIAVELNRYKTHATDYKAAPKSVRTIEILIESLDLMGRTVVG